MINNKVSQVLLLGRTVFWIRTVFTKEYNVFEKSVRPDNFYARTDFSKTYRLPSRCCIFYGLHCVYIKVPYYRKLTLHEINDNEIKFMEIYAQENYREGI